MLAIQYSSGSDSRVLNSELQLASALITRAPSWRTLASARQTRTPPGSMLLQLCSIAVAHTGGPHGVMNIGVVTVPQQ